MRILTVLAFFVTVSSFAMDITTLHGTVYKDVKILGIYPTGIDFSYKGDGSGAYIAGENFTNLPETIRKKYGYKPERAKKFAIKSKEFQEHRYEEAKKKAAEHLRQLKVKEHIDDTVGAFVNAHRISRMRFQVTRTYRNGSLVVLADPGYSETVGARYGQIFIQGYTDSEQNSWGYGTFYPTGRTIKIVEGTFQVYTPNYDYAVSCMEKNLRGKSK